MKHSHVRVVSAEIQQHGRYLLTQRSAKAVMPNLWEFPGGRVREGESDQEALQRALQHRVGASATIGDLVLEVTHNYADYTVVLAVYVCDLGAHKPVAAAVQAVAWVAPAHFAEYPFPPADEASVTKLVQALDG